MPYLPEGTAQVVGYVDERLKVRAVGLKRYDHRMTISRIIEESMRAYLPTLEKQLKPQPR